jgi:L-ascorbate metabolism protein UlaG (beta-lactamase superfamily)
MAVRWRWLGTACFEFQLPGGEAVVVDPYMDDAANCPVSSEAISRADIICITHGHFDHILDVGRLANRLGSTVICSQRVARNVRERFGVPAEQVRPVTVGDTLRLGPIRIEVVRAVHVDNRQYFAEQLGLELTHELSAEDVVRQAFTGIKDPDLRERFLSYMGKFPAGEQLNFIFQFPGNLRCHFFGSTPDPELFSVVEHSRAQVLFLQILCGREQAAAGVARRSGAAIVVPMHHDAFFPGQAVPQLEPVRASLGEDPGVTFVDPVPGQWYEIQVEIKG